MLKPNDEWQRCLKRGLVRGPADFSASVAAALELSRAVFVLLTTLLAGSNGANYDGRANSFLVGAGVYGPGAQEHHREKSDENQM